MAKLSWTVETAAGDVTKDGPNISDANMNRFLDWLWYVYPQYIDPNDPAQGLKPKNNANIAAAYSDWAWGQWLGVKDQVISWEKLEAAQEASAGIPDIPDA